MGKKKSITYSALTLKFELFVLFQDLSQVQNASKTFFIPFKHYVKKKPLNMH